MQNIHFNSKEELISFASSFYLTQCIPLCILEEGDDAIESFIEDNVWEPMEGFSANYIYEAIESAADAIEEKFNLEF